MSATKTRVRGGLDSSLDLAEDDDERASLPEMRHPLDSLGSGLLINDRFRLDQLLGSGGMGTVWLARDTSLEIDVAMKVLRPDVPKAFREQAAQRLLTEARASAKLQHPGIVRITDYGQTESGDPYIVMERLDGLDLCGALEANGSVSPARALRTILPVLDALRYAHGQGVLHRDIKPENIFITRSSKGTVQPKLIDFGIALLDAPSAESKKRGSDARLTRPGAVLGSPGYMSPEQARGEEADQQSDLWSVAVVLYEMLCDDLPFDGENHLALIRAIIEREPEPLMGLPDVDEELWKILKRGLAKNRNDRWRSAEQFGVAIAGWLLKQGYTDDITGNGIASAWLEERPDLTPQELFSEEEEPIRASGWGFELSRVPKHGPPSSPNPDSTRARVRPRADSSSAHSSVEIEEAATMRPPPSLASATVTRESIPERRPFPLIPAVALGVGLAIGTAYFLLAGDGTERGTTPPAAASAPEPIVDDTTPEPASTSSASPAPSGVPSTVATAPPPASAAAPSPKAPLPRPGPLPTPKIAPSPTPTPKPAPGPGENPLMKPTFE